MDCCQQFDIPLNNPNTDCSPTNPIAKTTVERITIYRNGDFGFIAGVEFSPAVVLRGATLRVTVRVPETTQIGRNEYTSSEPIGGVAVFCQNPCPVPLTTTGSVVLTVGDCTRNFSNLPVQ